MNARWTERQREMLGAMGVRLFEAPHRNFPEPNPVRPEVSKGESEPVEGLRQAQPGPSIPQGERILQDESHTDIATLDRRHFTVVQPAAGSFQLHP